MPTRRRVHEIVNLFRRACGGNVMILFAFACIPLLLLAGAAMDYSRGAMIRTRMQSALDTAALMVAKEAPFLTPSQLTAKAKSYYEANLKADDLDTVTFSATYTNADGSNILLSTTGTVPTAVMQLAGIDHMDLDTQATASWGNTRLRVSLVLDNTGSMASSGKIDALIAASHNLLAQLKSVAVDPADVYVSIIPFSKDVNVGAANYTMPWLRWDLWDAANGTCSLSTYTNKATCVANGRIWTPKAHSTWNGCVTDRDQNNDANATDPVAGNQPTLFPAEQFGSCSLALMALSNDWTALDDEIDAMTPVGNTNQTIGMQWGLQSLIAGAPLPVPAQDVGYKYGQVIVLLTDGLNTQNRWSTTQSTIDARTKAICDTAKMAGATIYSAQVNTSGDPTSAMLQDCASGPSKFFLLTSASEIVSTFNSIGTELAKLRLTM